MLKQFCIALFLLCLASQSLYANDLDDGIGIDEKIDDDLQLNSNVEFIKRNAVAKAKRGTAISNSGCGGVGNQSFGPGANLKGATIVNLSDNKGANSVCVEK